MEQPTRENTKYHGAFLFNERLHQIFTALDDVTIARETETDKKRIFGIIKQNWGSLIVLYKELIAEMNTEEEEHHQNAWRELSLVYRSCKTEFEKGNKVKIDFIDDFDVWEMQLRKFAKIRGLIMPDKTEMDKAMEV